MAVDSYKDQLNGSGWALCALATLLVAARCYCRVIIVNRFSWDDGFMLFALASAIVTVALVTVSTTYGFGQHLLAVAVNPHNLEMSIKYTLYPAAISIISSTAGKISVVLFLLRLLGHSARPVHKWFLWSVTASMVALNVFAIILILGKCIPLEKVWRPDTPGSCMDPKLMSIGGRVQAGFNALMDLLTAVFPAYMVSSLKMKRSTKWGLSFLMGGGIFAAASTIVKVYYMKDIDNFADLTYSWGPIATWYMAEINVLIITSTIPTLKPLYNVCLGRFPASTANYASGSNQKGYSGGSGPSNSTQSGTHGSRSGFSKLFGSGNGGSNKRPGSVTMALDDIDAMRTNHQDGESSSVEYILPKSEEEGQQQQAQQHGALQQPQSLPLAHLNPHGQARTTTGAVAVPASAGIHQYGGQPGNNIHIETSVSVVHGDRGDGASGRHDPYHFA